MNIYTYFFRCYWSSICNYIDGLDCGDEAG